ncbi:MAG TPA: hypothetical protein VK061_04755 [Bacillota bacterium]|nr:hypothetical protein [Bacillota bacterium]
MTKRKWLYLIIIVALATPVLLLYFAFEGNPIGKFNAKRTLDKHLEETYPDQNFVIHGPASYNFKDGGYHLTAEEIDKETSDRKEYEFSIVGIFGTKVHYDGIYFENLDQPLMNKFEREANKEILEKLQLGIPDVREVQVTIEVLEGTYDWNTKWHKDLELEEPLSIWVAIDGENKTEDDIVEIGKIMQKILNDHDYDYKSATINSRINHEGSVMLNYSAGFAKDEEITKKNVDKENKEHGLH